VVTTAPPDLLAAAKSFAPQIEACREQSERDRSLPPELVRAMAEAGLFRTWVPRALGGWEADLATNMRLIEEVSKYDGAAGWTAMIFSTGGMFSAYLPLAGAKEIYGDPNVTAAGAIAPKGRAVAEKGGFRLTGRWPLASGCLHSGWIAGGSLPFDGDAPRLGEGGIPDLHILFVPARDCEIIDTWYSAGLRGTGSHDFAVHEVFVPEDHAFSLLQGRPQHDGTLYRASIPTLFSPAVCAVSLGIARAAIDAFVELAAGGKTPTFSRSMLRDRGTVQAQVAQAEALLRSARAFLFETIDSVWETMQAGDKLSDEQEALMRLAATHTAGACAQAVDMMYTLGGATSVYATSKLERCFRDVHVITQHIGVSPSWYERTGQHFLGMGMPLFG
jgi:indole-3-acetate monooxygenase